MTNNKCIVAVGSSNSYLTKLVGVKERPDDVGYREIVIRSTSGRRASFSFSSIRSLSAIFTDDRVGQELFTNDLSLVRFDSTRLDSTRFDSIRFDSIRLKSWGRLLAILRARIHAPEKTR